MKETLKPCSFVFLLGTVLLFTTAGSVDCQNTTGILDTIHGLLTDLVTEFQSLSSRVQSMEITLNKLSSGTSSGRLENFPTAESLPTGSSTEKEYRENLREELIREMLVHPRARLYSEEGFKGQFEDFDLGNTTLSQGCFMLDALLGKAKSIQTYETCVRLFYFHDCLGNSLAIYPGGSRDPKKFLSAEFQRVVSIGPCLQNEFEHSTLSNGSLVKSSPTTGSYETPDLVDISGHNTKALESRYVRSPTSSVERYLQGFNNRVEWLYADIYGRHVEQKPHRSDPSQKIERTSFWKSLEKLEGDSVGFAIPLPAGGPPETYNVFPQSESNRREWGSITGRLPLYVRMSEDKYVYVFINFCYENSMSSRPYGFYYWIQFSNKSKLIYGFIRN